MNLFDFHCDLPGALLHSGNTLWKSNGHGSKGKEAGGRPYQFDKKTMSWEEF